MTWFCVMEAGLDALDAEEGLRQLRAHKAAEPDVPPDVQAQIEAFRSFQS